MWTQRIAKGLMITAATVAIGWLGAPVAFGGSAGPEPKSTSGVTPHPLAATLAAHGGRARFDRFATMAYTMKGFPLSEPMAKENRSTVDLRTRRNRIDGVGFTVGFDGTQAWADPGPDAVGLPSRFVTLGSFYFIGMPFVFADQGAVVTVDEPQTFRGRTYDVFRVGYQTGTGYTAKDDYVIFVDPASRRLALIHHSVTEKPDVDRVTWTFDRWQEVDGLLVPAQMTFYPGWNAADPGAGHTFTVEDVRFDEAAPADALYAPSAVAVVE